MVQTEEASLTLFTPYTRGHKPTPSQVSNTLSEVSCTTTLSSSSDRQEDQDTQQTGEGRFQVERVRQGPVEVSTSGHRESGEFDQIMVGTFRDSQCTLTGHNNCGESYRRGGESQNSVKRSNIEFEECGDIFIKHGEKRNIHEKDIILQCG